MVHAGARLDPISCDIVVKESVEQVLWENNVHGLSGAERLGHEREHREHIGDLEGKVNPLMGLQRGRGVYQRDTNEVRVEDFGVMQETCSPFVVELHERTCELFSEINKGT